VRHRYCRKNKAQPTPQRNTNPRAPVSICLALTACLLCGVRGPLLGPLASESILDCFYGGLVALSVMGIIDVVGIVSRCSVAGIAVWRDAFIVGVFVLGGNGAVTFAEPVVHPERTALLVIVVPNFADAFGLVRGNPRRQCYQKFFFFRGGRWNIGRRRLAPGRYEHDPDFGWHHLWAYIVSGTVV